MALKPGSSPVHTPKPSHNPGAIKTPPFPPPPPPGKGGGKK
jgi:hypothetical protein